MKISIRLVSLAASVLALTTLTACVQPQPVYETARYPYQAPPPPPQPTGPNVEYGRIANIEVVQSQSSGAAPTGVGAVAGGVVGGVLGHQVGSGRGNTAATIVGAGAGAYAGNEVEKNKNKVTTYVVKVKLDDGNSRTFNFSQPTSYQIGDKIRIHHNKLVRQ